VPLGPEQMPKMEVLDVREKPSQQFDSQGCWVAGLGGWPHGSLGVCVLEGGGGSGRGAGCVAVPCLPCLEQPRGFMLCFRSCSGACGT